MEGTDATPEEVAEFREIFNLVDTDGSGAISNQELQQSVLQVGDRQIL